MRNEMYQKRCIRVVGLLFLINFCVLAYYTVHNRHVKVLSSSSIKAHYRRFSNQKAQEFETCDQWVNLMRSSHSYVDAFMIGAQKSASTQFFKVLYDAQILRQGYKKEWHFLSNFGPDGELYPVHTTHHEDLPTIKDMEALRKQHHNTSIYDIESAFGQTPPVIDSRAQEKRQILMDMSMNSILSDRSAYLARALQPHSKIVISIRDPVERALSEYNMMKRQANERAKPGQNLDSANAEEFDTLVRKQAKMLESCGFDPDTGVSQSTTSKLIACMTEQSDKNSVDDMLYVVRGLYAIQINQWRDYFPDHRIMILNFPDIISFDPAIYRKISDFLCVGQVPNQHLDKYNSTESKKSLGMQSSENGAEQLDIYNFSGKNRYLSKIWPSTEKFLRKFYRTSDEALAEMLGKSLVYWV